MPGQNLFYTERTAAAGKERIITLAGLAQLADDVKQMLKEKSNKHRLFIINTPEDISVLIKLMPANAYYSVILQSSTEVHKTPILIHHHRFLILDSLGQADNFHQIKDLILSSYPKASPPTILFSAHARQSDQYNCGSDAIAVARKALILGPQIIDEQAEKGEKYCHPEFAQLTQSVARIKPTARKGVKETYQDTHPMSTLVVDDKTLQATTLQGHFINKDVIAAGKYNLYLDQLAAEDITRLDALQHLPEEEIKQRAYRAFPLRLLEKASTQTLKKFFLNDKERKDFIDEKLITKRYPGLTIIAIPLRHCPLNLKNKQEAIQSEYTLLETAYAQGNQSISLVALAKLKYLLAYIEEQLVVLKQSDTPLFQQKKYLSDNAHLKTTPERRPRSTHATPDTTPERKPEQQKVKFFTPATEKTPLSELHLPFDESSRDTRFDAPTNHLAAAEDDEEEWGAACDKEWEENLEAAFLEPTW